MQPLRSSFVCVAITVAFQVGHASTTEAVQDAWKSVNVPNVWKNPPAGQAGYSWYRCAVRVPRDWEGRKLAVFSEPVDDAREVYLNGVLVGRAGGFPPQFRSGLGAPDRNEIAADLVRFGEPNLVAIRIYNSDGRTGFNVAAPVLFAGDEAIRLAGEWSFRAGDNQQWAVADSPEALTRHVFDKTQQAAEVEKVLRRLPGEEGPLTVSESVRRFETPDDLIVEPVLSEPHIGQPLFIDFDERGRLWVLNYQQYPNPAGLTAVSRDKYLRTVYDKVPMPPPHHVRGRDKITIHEDTDGDGIFDAHKTFIDGLNIATSFARGRGGLFVLNPPYLLFYPDRDHDDVPDGDPEVLLEGFGLEDSHSVANNLRWGPDGWLYAAQGSTVTGQIKRHGSKESPTHSMGQLIWRYHPETRRYEIFAEGGGNAFGVEIDSKGRVFSGHNGGDTRGFHYVQGGYYRKGFGKHGELSNPYAFGYFANIQHHSVPRFTHTFVIYEGAALSAQYAGRLFGVGPLQSHVIHSDIQPRGASFQTRDIGTVLASSDPWFRPVQIKVGPDGAIYVCDFHEQRIDHASHYQGRVTPDTGRIYRLRAPDAPASKPFDYGQLESTALIDLLRKENKWHRQIALRLIADRRDPLLRQPLRTLLFESDGQLALEALWALNLCDGLTDAVALEALKHEDPFVRLWTARLACDDREVTEEMQAALEEMAVAESNVEVRCQLACSARRLAASSALPIVRRLLDHDEDTSDVFMPLLLWWAIESKVATDRGKVVGLFRDLAVWDRPLVKEHLVERLMRRLATSGARKDLLACAQLLELAPNKDLSRRLLKGFETAFSGRTLGDLPDELVAALAATGGGSLELRLRRGDPIAIEEGLKVIADVSRPDSQRARYIQIYGQIGVPECLTTLLHLIANDKSDLVRSAALTALQSYDDPRIAAEVTRVHNSVSPQVRDVAQAVMASRRAWARELLEAVDSGKLAREDISSEAVQRILFHDDPQLESLVRKHWGSVETATTDEMRTEVQRLQGILAGAAGNPYKGKRLYLDTCGKCHVLFTDGGKIGPNLTSYKRDDLRGIILNVVNPSLEIREGFENFVVFTEDGRTLTGFVADQDNRVVVLKSADGQSIVIPRDEIDDMRAIPRSIMPEGILKPLSDQQIRDLFSYIRSTQPLP